MKELDLGDMFEAGAKSVALEAGMQEKDAQAFAESMRKEAKLRYNVVDDEDDDEDDDEEGGTWWSRNKGWAIPLGVGLGAFAIGADAATSGRPDWNIFANAGRLFYERLERLLGIPNSDRWRHFTQADPNKLLLRRAKDKATREMEELESLPRGEPGSTTVAPKYLNSMTRLRPLVLPGDRFPEHGAIAADANTLPDESNPRGV